MTRRRRLAVLVATGSVAVGTLAGCASTVSLQAAPDANDPLCAQITAYLPSTLDGQARRWTDAQATGAWGDPASIIVSCGVTPPGASTLPCQTVDGVDWLIDDSEAPYYRFTTFGRTPAVEVYLDYDVVSSFDTLDALAPLVGKLPVDAACTDRPDS
ncbi:MAG: DUF3515 family protein [Microbacterium sp.]|uniref:DUF3515 family protein n=1 Tax=Microbacterium sp. TaxID=51671 RepID=UPI0039E3F678